MEPTPISSPSLQRTSCASRPTPCVSSCIAGHASFTTAMARSFRVVESAAGWKPPTAPPTAHEVGEAASEFWFKAIWAAKKLGRGELWRAVECCNGDLKRLLLLALEWEARTRASTTGTAAASSSVGRPRSRERTRWDVRALRRRRRSAALRATMDLYASSARMSTAIRARRSASRALKSSACSLYDRAQRRPGTTASSRAGGRSSTSTARRSTGSGRSSRRASPRSTPRVARAGCSSRTSRRARRRRLATSRPTCSRAFASAASVKGCRRPNLYAQAMHELDLPRRYRTIIVCGGWASAARTAARRRRRPPVRAPRAGRPARPRQRGSVCDAAVGWTYWRKEERGGAAASLARRG